MARDRANINTAIWTDQDFRDLNMAEQHLYKLLMTHPTLSYAGVADWRPARIAAMTADATAEGVQATAEALQAKRYVFIDDETEEILVRSFLRHDGLLKQPKLSISMVNAFGAIASKRVREVVTYELQRLQQEHPDWAAFGQPKVLDLLKGKGTDMGEFTDGVTPELTLPFTPSFTPAVTPLFRPTGGQAQALPTATATTTATSPSGEGVRGNRSKPELRLPDKWQPNDAHRDYAKAKHLDLDTEAERFRLHAQAHDRKLRDWDAGFRMWLSKAQPQQHSASPWSKEFHG
ncbi:hypothetical protein [Arthrobacter sp. SD76]|uniref:hypothetical protein n=1 Tax=Arthrobacter sp. SD76 TaxID=3415007 RepID=UPI003C77F3D6